MGFLFYQPIMKAKAYRLSDQRWRVYLSWMGKKYFRYHYDGDIPLVHESMARQIADAINADILTKKKSFEPRKWFKTPGYEFEFRTYSEKWLTRQTHYAPSVIKDVSRSIHLAIGFFEKTDIREIRKGQIDDFLESLPDHLSPKSKKNILTYLHKLFTDAVDREDLPRVPGWPSVQVQTPEIKWIQPEWQDKILEAIDPIDRPIFKFIRSYGCRPGEARALQWDCVDLEKGLIIIKRTFSGRKLVERTKTRLIRYLPITTSIGSLLRDLRAISGFVFRNRKGRPYSDHLPAIWNDAVKRVGAPTISLYQGTRHSLGCQLLNDGQPIEAVRKLFGHTKDEMTRRYAEISTKSLKGILEKKVVRTLRGGR